MSVEFRVEGVRIDRIPCRRNSVSTEFRVDGIQFRTELRVDGIPFRRGNSVSTEFRGLPGVHNVNKNFKKCFYYKYVETRQSHFILTMSHWFSGLTCLIPVTRDPGYNLQGVLV